MAQALTGLSGLAGINAIAQPETTAFATPEERHGGPQNPYHGVWGEQARPFSYESLAVPAASHGPYGLENQLLADEMWFIEPAGMPESDPRFDENTPSLTRSHASVKNVTISGPVPSQYDAICQEIEQMDNKASDLGTAHSMQSNMLGFAKQDNWLEIWEVNTGNSDVPATTRQIAFQANGIGVNDAPSNVYHKSNLFGWGAKHFHRRYAQSPLPGNYLYLRPQGRPLFKTIAGPARPAIGIHSQFTGDDLGDAFAYNTGATLMNTPEEYIPPPAPLLTQRTSVYDDPNGTNPIEWY